MPPSMVESRAGSPSGPRAARRVSAAVWGPVAWGLAAMTLVVGCWQLVVVLARLPEVLLPSPWDVATKMVEVRAMLWTHGLVTLREILIGFGLAVIVGFPVALVIAFVKPLDKLALPLLVVSNSVPKVAIAPLLLIWFGFGPVTNALLALLTAIFPVVVNCTLGLTNVNPELLRLGRMMGGSRWRLFRLIRLPAALPGIFAGLKLAISLATIGAILGELIAGQAGLGYLSQFAASQMQTPLTFACIVTLSALGVLLFYAVVWVEYLVMSPNHLSHSR